MNVKEETGIISCLCIMALILIFSDATSFPLSCSLMSSRLLPNWYLYYSVPTSGCECKLLWSASSVKVSLECLSVFVSCDYSYNVYPALVAF